MPKYLKDLRGCPWCGRRPVDLTGKKHNFGPDVTAEHHCNHGKWYDFDWLGTPRSWEAGIAVHSEFMKRVSERGKEPDGRCPTCGGHRRKGNLKAREELEAEMVKEARNGNPS